jgi:hypothetical protein
VTDWQMSGARGGWNALLLVAPAVPLRVLTGGRQPTDGQTRLRVLGARHVPQAAGPSARVATRSSRRRRSASDACACASGGAC